MMTNLNNNELSTITSNHKTQHKLMLGLSVVFLIVCLLPFVGMLWSNDEPVSDGGSISQMPQPVTAEGSANLYFFQELGAYFETHFAYRNIAIEANARLRAGVFNTSPTDQVVVGTDGWLYYSGTLSDYLAQDPLTERQAENIAHNLSVMQGFTRAMGAEFLFTIGPNKNTLYPNYMPYYLLQGNNNSMTLLEERLKEKDVNYVDLFALFASTDEELYCKTDSHWNTEGALLATNALLRSAGADEAIVVSSEPSQIVGDIERMLYPVAPGSEPSLDISTGNWSYSGTSITVEDDIVLTTSEKDEGYLLMYRDSFANTLIPLLAPEFARSQFTKMIPYNFMQVVELKPSVVIVERAERHVGLLGEDPPFMYAPSTFVSLSSPPVEIETDSLVEWRVDGDFRVIEGYIDANFELDADAEIFLAIEGPGFESDTSSSSTPENALKVYVPFYTTHSGENEISSDYGFRMFLNEESLTEGTYTISVMVSSEDGIVNYSVVTASFTK